MRFLGSSCFERNGTPPAWWQLSACESQGSNTDKTQTNLRCHNSVFTLSPGCFWGMMIYVYFHLGMKPGFWLTPTVEILGGKKKSQNILALTKPVVSWNWSFDIKLFWEQVPNNAVLSNNTEINTFLLCFSFLIYVVLRASRPRVLMHTLFWVLVLSIPSLRLPSSVLPSWR